MVAKRRPKTQPHPFDDLEGNILSHPALKSVPQSKNLLSGLTVDSAQRQALFKFIENDINSSDRFMTRMKDDYRNWMQLRLRIAHTKALLSPVRNLPTELLGRTFTLLAVEKSFKASYLTQIMLVCRHWREVAITTPALWADIYYQDYRTPADNPPVSLWLERTKKAHFDICAYLTRDAKFLKAVVPHAHRMRSLDMRLGGSKDVGEAFEVLLSRADSLESLCVRGPKYNMHEFTQVVKPSWFTINAPKLTHLELDYCGYRSTLFSPNLESLILNNIDFEDRTMLELSQLAPNLKHLELHRCLVLDEPSREPVKMQSLQALEIKDIWPGAYSVDEYTEWSGIWDILNGAPLRNKLKVRIRSSDLSRWGTPLLHLTQLHVDFRRPMLDDEDEDQVDELVGITDWSNEMPSLQRLTICGLLTICGFECEAYANCNGLMQALLPSSPSFTYIFPLLEELVLNCCEADVDILLHFSRERSPSATAGFNRACKPCRVTLLDWIELPDVQSAFSDQLEHELREAGMIESDDESSEEECESAAQSGTDNTPT